MAGAGRVRIFPCIGNFGLDPRDDSHSTTSSFLGSGSSRTRSYCQQQQQQHDDENQPRRTKKEKPRGLESS
jgi:hypothetical protein